MCGTERPGKLEAAALTLEEGEARYGAGVRGIVEGETKVSKLPKLGAMARDAHGARIVSLPTSPLLNDAAGGILPEIDLSADADDHSLLALPAELIVVVLEQLPFAVLLAARATCTRLRAMALSVTRAARRWREVGGGRPQRQALPLPAPSW